MALKLVPLALPEIIEITPQRFEDERGFFTESYNHQRFVEHGIDYQWVQDNHSFSKVKNVLRGLHLQTPDKAQDKLVRVITGAVFDVAVDVRKGSPNYGNWVAVTLSAERGNQLLIPAGFAHGFLTLTEETHVAYKVTDYYSAAHEVCLRYDDPEIGIEWPLSGTHPQLSEKDLRGVNLSDTESGFRY